jgi:hypothetical protein
MVALSHALSPGIVSWGWGIAMISKLTTLETALLVAAMALVFAFAVGAL